MHAGMVEKFKIGRMMEIGREPECRLNREHGHEVGALVIEIRRLQLGALRQLRIAGEKMEALQKVLQTRELT